MRIYALTGDRHKAIGHYRQLRAALERALDAEPEPATQQLYEEILTGRTLAEGSLRQPVTPVSHAWPGTKDARLMSPGAPSAVHRGFIGRDSELAELEGHLSRNRLLTLTGAGGV